MLIADILLLDDGANRTVGDGDTLVDTTTTANGGQYAFTSLSMGDYLALFIDALTCKLINTT